MTDAVGNAYWSDKISQGGTMLEIVNDFIDSNECNEIVLNFGL